MNTKQKVLVFKDVRQAEVESFPLPVIPDDKVLVKIEASAICTWEQRVYTGIKKVPMPFVGGHEMSGTIVEMGKAVDTREWGVGMQVVIGAMLPCGNCYLCKSGNAQNCSNFNHAGQIQGLPYVGMGGFSSHMVVHPDNLFKFRNISFEEAAISEPLSCVVHSVETGNIGLGDTVVVIGCGIMGLLHVILAHYKGAEVIAFDLNPQRLLLAKKLGASHIVNAGSESLADRVSEITGGLMAQVVFDTTPVAELVKVSMQCVCNTGRVVLYSSFYPDVPVAISPDWLHKSGVALMGSANSNAEDFVTATRLLSSGVVNVKDLISEVYDLEDAVEALESASKGDKFRVIIRF